VRLKWYCDRTLREYMDIQASNDNAAIALAA